MNCLKQWKHYFRCKGGGHILKIGLIGIVSVFLGLILRKEKGEFAILVGLAAGIVIFVYALAQFSAISQFIGGIWEQLPVEHSFMIQLLKMLGITYVADFSAGICKDNGYQAVGGQIELFAKLSILALSIPGLAYLTDVLEQFL